LKCELYKLLFFIKYPASDICLESENGAGDMAQTVQHLPSKHEALNLNTPVPPEKTKRDTEIENGLLGMYVDGSVQSLASHIHSHTYTHTHTHTHTHTRKRKLDKYVCLE
jgi:hypothetical protein